MSVVVCDRLSCEHNKDWKCTAETKLSIEFKTKNRVEHIDIVVVDGRVCGTWMEVSKHLTRAGLTPITESRGINDIESLKSHLQSIMRAIEKIASSE